MSVHPEASAKVGRWAAALRGFGPIGILSLLAVFLGNALFAPLSAMLALAWARASRTPWSAFGFVRPKGWASTLVLGVVLGVGLKLLMKSVVMPLLGADPVNHAYHFLVGNWSALPWALFMVIVVAGFGEEIVYRGFLFERFGKLWGTAAGGRTATVLVTSALFGAVHLGEQGFAGAEQAAIVGLVVGTLVASTGQIWLPIVLHATFDVTAVAIIYWDLETRVSSWFFR